MPEHPIQGSPTQSSGADVVAARAAQNAITENEKIFPIFAQRLASNEPKEFVNTTRKLAAWLSSEKAYYPAARPKIVELLEIALSAFMDTFVHHTPLADIAEHLRQLIQVVVPFKHLFRENELQSRLQRVILDTTLCLSRVSTGNIRTTVPSEGPVVASIPPSTHVPLASPRSAASPPATYHSPTWRPRPFLSMPNVEKHGPVGSIHAEQLRARNSPEVAHSSHIEATPTFSSPVIKTQSSGDDVSPTTTSKPLPRRARRVELSEELMARDLDWFRSNQSTMMNKDLNMPPSTAGESSPPPPSDAPHVPRRSPSPKKKTARMVPSRRLPRRILDITQGAESGTTVLSSAPESLARKDGSSENVEDTSAQIDQMDIDKEAIPMETMKSDSCSAAVQASDEQQVLRPDHQPFPEPQPVATPSNEPSIERQTPQTDYQSPTAEGSFTNNSSMPVRPPALDGMESMDVVVSESDFGDVRFSSQGKLEPTAPRMPLLRTLILPPLVNSMDPPLDLNFIVSQISPSQSEPLGGDAAQWRFNDGIAILHSMQGKAFSHAHVVDLNLSENTFSKVLKWVKRRSYPSEAFQAVCISLACYRLPEFCDTIKSENGKPNIETLTKQSSCSWPTSNRVSLHIKGKKRHTIVTLSPPLFLTPDRCVDISSSMELGNNTLEFSQGGDLSEYLIVLHAHSPTRSQLAELDVVRSADERWRRFLDVLSGRVAPGKVLGNSPTGVIEAHS